MLEENLAVEAQAFVSKETGKCKMMIAKEIRGGELGKQIVQCIADSVATYNNICIQYGYRPKAKDKMVDTACAVIAPGQAKAPTTPTDMNTFHCTYGHSHEVLLKKTAEQQGVNLSGELYECRGCLMTKGLRKPIARSTHIRAGSLCPSRAPATTAPYCQREGRNLQRGRA